MFLKFYLLQSIGEGATSKIFKALQEPIHRVVALKIPSFQKNQEILNPDEFLSEAILMAKLDHPNIVRIYDFGVSENRAFICMEYIEGPNLEGLIEARGPLSIGATVDLISQLLQGLAHAHRNGILHLDLSPANILIQKNGTVKLSDFGLAGKGSENLKGKIIGTPLYLSPEHIRGSLNEKADIFSCAGLIYFAATGKHLFEIERKNSEGLNNSEHQKEILRSIEGARENPPLKKIQALPQALGDLVLLAFQNLEIDSLLKKSRELWTEFSKDAAIGSLLQKEMQSDALALEAQYLAFREKGQHREAIALLEKIVKEFPQHPKLQEWLVTPSLITGVSDAPKTQTQVQTQEQAQQTAPGKVPSEGELQAQEANESPPNRMLWIGLFGLLALGILGVTLFSLRSHTKNNVSAAPRTTVLVENPANLSSQNPATIPSTIPSLSSSPNPTPNLSANPKPNLSPRSDSIPTQISTSALVKPSSETTPAKPNLKAKKKSPLEPAFVKPIPKEPTILNTKTAALSVTGPAGTHIVVNDTLQWVSPSPREGWILPSGLIRISLSIPGSANPIRSSLFVSADTLYNLLLDNEGGFSISRLPR